MENNIIYHKSVDFSLLLLQSLDGLHAPSYQVLINQLRRSGTAIGASIAEADSAQSMLDFISKMKIADKEANETLYWLKLLEKEFPSLSEKMLGPLLEIKRILRSILVTCMKKRKEKKQA
jgi:four helix bundle protein